MTELGIALARIATLERELTELRGQHTRILSFCNYQEMYRSLLTENFHGVVAAVKAFDDQFKKSLSDYQEGREKVR